MARGRAFYCIAFLNYHSKIRVKSIENFECQILNIRFNSYSTLKTNKLLQGV